MRREKGFSLLELLIVMLIMGFVLAAGSQMFVGMLSGYKQQSKIAETNIEGIIGLDMLRRDLEGTGYGLPWQLPVGTNYKEASDPIAATYNDSTTVSPPRAIISGDSMTAAGYVTGSDYLVIKALNVGRNDACTKWAYLSSDGTTTSWKPSTEDLESSDKVIVISPGTPESGGRTLVLNSGQFSATYGNLSNFASVNETRIVYGVSPVNGGDPLIMPFNRADYYVSTTAEKPYRCAAGTGVLMKAILNPSKGEFDPGVNTVPLLDCVADMQVSFKLDRNQDGNLSDAPELKDLSGNSLTAAQIRDQLREIRVYVLAHEGQRDTSYVHSVNSIRVGEPGIGQDFDLTKIQNWQNYRWKLYAILVKPNNLR